MINLQNQHILVIGGSRGIGAAIARTAALEANANVSLTYTRGAEAAEAVTRQIRDAGGKARAIRCEMGEEKAVREAIGTAWEEGGPIQGLVVSASVVLFQPLLETSPEDWDRIQQINLRGTFLVVREFARRAIEAADGLDRSIVILTSTAGQPGGKGGSAYSVSKAGQIRLMKGFANELAPHRIRVNCLAPAWTETDMANDQLDKLGRAKIAGNFPLGRIGLPEDAAVPTCFLLSAGAAFMTGSTLTVDGGMAMQG